MAQVNADKLRVAMIGAGGMANRVHYPSLASLPDVEVAAICDLDARKLHQTADTYGIEKRYTDYRKMIETTAPDAVFAIGPVNFMYPIWVWCLQRGLNLYIEKPLGVDLHQARNLAWLAEQHDCITTVSFQRRSCPMVVRLHEECLTRGPITHAVCEFYKPGPEPFIGFVDHRIDDSVHSIDTLRWMCGGEVLEVESTSRRVGTPDINFISATLHFDNGSTGFLINSWASGRRVFRVEMHAPGIAVDAEHEGKGFLYADGDYQGVEYDSREVAGSEHHYVFGGFQAKHREFFAGIRTGKQPSSCFADALKTMEVAERIASQAMR